MKANARKKIRQLPEKLATITTVLVLVSAWALGGLRLSDQESEQLSYLTPEGAAIEQVSSGFYQVTSQTEAPEGEESSSHWLSRGTGIGYGGAMEISVTVDDNNRISQLAVLNSRETSSYLKKVIAAKLPEQVIGQTIDKIIEVDAISGATLTSNAIARGVNQAAEPVRQHTLGKTLIETTSPLSYFGWMDAMAVLVFAVAYWLSKTRHPRRKAMQWGLMLTSLVLFGFYTSALFSSSSMGILVSGIWVSGLGNYTSLILLVLTIAGLLITNKNFYCDTICPFGTAQQCLGKITNPPTVTLKQQIFTWFPRVLLLAVLALGLYYRNPAAIAYEPFGIMFGMTGAMQLFALTFLIVLTSLVIYRPWCKFLCPVSAMSDFLKFAKSWGKQLSKDHQRGKTRTAPKANAIAHRSISS